MSCDQVLQLLKSRKGFREQCIVGNSFKTFAIPSAKLHQQVGRNWPTSASAEPRVQTIRPRTIL